jgi:hypothetical protein
MRFVPAETLEEVLKVALPGAVTQPSPAVSRP